MARAGEQNPQSQLRNMKKSFSRIYGAVLPMMALAAELGGLSSLATEPDTTPPQALSAAALGGGAIVGVAFNEALDARARPMPQTTPSAAARWLAGRR